MPNKCSFSPVPEDACRRCKEALAELQQQENKRLSVSEAEQEEEGRELWARAWAEVVVLSMELKYSQCHREHTPGRTQGHDGLRRGSRLEVVGPAAWGTSIKVRAHPRTPFRAPGTTLSRESGPLPPSP